MSLQMFCVADAMTCSSSQVLIGAELADRHFNLEPTSSIHDTKHTTHSKHTKHLKHSNTQTTRHNQNTWNTRNSRKIWTHETLEHSRIRVAWLIRIRDAAISVQECNFTV